MYIKITLFSLLWVGLLIKLLPFSGTILGASNGLGYSRQYLKIGATTFTVQMVAADSSNTKIIVDTASASGCGDNCPVLPLKTYITRNRAIAGINGSYFCPSAYPGCSGKKNNFDLLLMNKDKVYFNSDNNVYSSNPGFIFGGSYVRVVREVSQWGRDTAIDGMISNYPLLVFNKELVFSGANDPKWNSRGLRNFVANNGNRVYLGFVRNATLSEAARVLQAMGVDNAMNLDSGGSTALWANGRYQAGPGRQIPNAILFVPR